MSDTPTVRTYVLPDWMLDDNTQDHMESRIAMAGGKAVAVFKADEIAIRDRAMHLCVEQILALAVEGNEIGTIAQRLLALLEGLKGE